MRHAGDRAIERAEEMVDLERATTIAGIRQRLSEPGSDNCAVCGEEISAQRRAAMPSARRCASCETRRELAAKRGW